MEYASTPLTPPASKTIVLQPPPAGAMPANRPTDLTESEWMGWSLLAVVAVIALIQLLRKT